MHNCICVHVGWSLGCDAARHTRLCQQFEYANADSSCRRSSSRQRQDHVDGSSSYCKRLTNLAQFSTIFILWTIDVGNLFNFSLNVLKNGQLPAVFEFRYIYVKNTRKLDHSMEDVWYNKPHLHDTHSECWWEYMIADFRQQSALLGVCTLLWAFHLVWMFSFVLKFNRTVMSQCCNPQYSLDVNVAGFRVCVNQMLMCYAWSCGSVVNEVGSWVALRRAVV